MTHTYTHTTGPTNDGKDKVMCHTRPLSLFALRSGSDVHICWFSQFWVSMGPLCWYAALSAAANHNNLCTLTSFFQNQCLLQYNSFSRGLDPTDQPSLLTSISEPWPLWFCHLCNVPRPLLIVQTPVDWKHATTCGLTWAPTIDHFRPPSLRSTCFFLELGEIERIF